MYKTLGMYFTSPLGRVNPIAPFLYALKNRSIIYDMLVKDLILVK
jgi:hypothetical protein